MTHLKILHPAGTLSLRLRRTCYRRFLQRRHLVVQLLLLRSRACAAAGRACRECTGSRLSCRLQLGLQLDNPGLRFGDDAGVTTTNKSVSQTRLTDMICCKQNHSRHPIMQTALRNAVKTTRAYSSSPAVALHLRG